MGIKIHFRIVISLAFKLKTKVAFYIHLGTLMSISDSFNCDAVFHINQSLIPAFPAKLFGKYL